ncbi:MAG: tetratricopeptide repeat protein [Treponema sp.]|nr:tetratricopeptide repeat protein [Treponema sp.]
MLESLRHKALSMVSAAVLIASASFFSCGTENRADKAERQYRETQEKLVQQLQRPDLGKEERYAIINRIASNMLSMGERNELIPFLTDLVEQNPGDTYNAYWLLMTAYAYLETDAEPVAEYYFERILSDCTDLMVQGKSIHFMCLQHLINISTLPSKRISYFNQLISRFPDDVSQTELYYRLALEYEKEGEWTLAIKSYEDFLSQSNASTIQIAGIPNAYLTARQLTDLNNSPKDWTFESLDSLIKAVKTAISSYDWRALDRYKSKVNFFAMSWRQDTTDINSQENFSMRSFMQGNRVYYNRALDDSSSPTEAYLRTWGWSNYVNVWYLYFRKINFPAAPDIHGRWEWAGIYFGEKL